MSSVDSLAHNSGRSLASGIKVARTRRDVGQEKLVRHGINSPKSRLTAARFRNTRSRQRDFSIDAERFSCRAFFFFYFIFIV
ncbi:hypothetical protein PUN28_015420 [Cardiocondyla obscurior]|uniref:Uncharacterized protein n=1 Tax=Cardiocondyla obscurior TaxID=286306 RepID=A0AAW2ESZ1_9HYME